MEKSLEIIAAPPFSEAIRVTAELFERLRIDAAFVGSVAALAWLEDESLEASVDVLALLSPDRMQHVPMMAANNGFVVDEQAVERARELDVIPMGWPTEERTVPIHVLLAMNSLYAWMIRDATEARFGDSTVKVVNRADYGLLLTVDDRPETRDRLRKLKAMMTSDEIDRLESKLVSIGLGGARRG